MKEGYVFIEERDTLKGFYDPTTFFRFRTCGFSRALSNTVGSLARLKSHVLGISINHEIGGTRAVQAAGLGLYFCVDCIFC